jgi:hypothetical protein
LADLKMKENIDELKKIVEQMHKCKAQFVESVPISETIEDRPVWQGVVHVFLLEAHTKTDKCYAWSSAIDGSTKRRYYAVLNIPPVDSPEKAVRAAIVHDYKKEKIKE